jgi:2-polyprenyl-6-methoxyphenol hydroxylase-like FAD-dependent oxidoreductase
VSSNRSLEVGVVGGSIAGCLMALELLADGHRVTVFERLHGELEGMLGAGLGTPTPMFRTLVERGLVETELPNIVLDDMLFVGRAAGGDRSGHVALSVPLTFVAFHWGDLHRGLRARLPDAVYRDGTEVSEVRNVDGDRAAVRLEDGTEQEFDLVVCADGYHSQTRRSMFPGSEPEYRGYVCWRGMLDERDMDSGELMDSNFVRFSSEGLPGSFLYPVPGPDGSVTRGERLVNWGCYVRVAPEELPDFLVDSDGNRREGAIPPGHMPAAHEDRLKEVAAESLPPYYAEIVTSSQGTFVQAIYSANVPAYHSGRVCLAGDAGALTPPFTGSGVFKAANNAIDLTAALDAEADVGAALARWDAAEVTSGRGLLDLGRQYEDAFVWNTPDLGAMEEAEAAKWWGDAVVYPEGFTFEAPR